MRFRVALQPGRDGRSHASVNAAAAADRRFGMANRIEQSRRHGQHDSRWIPPLHVVADSPLPIDAPADPIHTPPTLTLVGGTDVTPTLPDPSAHLRP